MDAYVAVEVARERWRVWWTITTESPRSTLKPKLNDRFDIEVGLRRVLHCPPNIGLRQGLQQVHGAAGTAVALPSGQQAVVVGSHVDGLVSTCAQWMSLSSIFGFGSFFSGGFCGRLGEVQVFELLDVSHEFAWVDGEGEFDS